MCGRALDHIGETFESCYPNSKPAQSWKSGYRCALKDAEKIVRDFLHESNQYEHLSESVILLAAIQLIKSLGDPENAPDLKQQEEGK